MKRTARGFTLIELLVVVAILAVLATIGVSVFSTTQKNARDGRTKADINVIARSIETARSVDPATSTVTYTYSSANYNADFKTIPVGKNAYCIGYSDSTGTWQAATPSGTWTTACNGTSKLINGTSTDWPTNSKQWVVCASLENTTAPKCVTSISQ